MAKLSRRIPFFNRILRRLTNIYGVLIITVVSTVSILQSYLGSPSVLGGLGDTVAELYRDFLGITSFLVVAWLITYSLKKYFSFKVQVPTFLNVVIITIGLAVIISPIGLGGIVGQTVFDLFSQILGDFLTVVLFIVGTIYFIDHAYNWEIIPRFLQTVGVNKTKAKVAGKPAAKKTKAEPSFEPVIIKPANNVSFNSSFHADNAMVKRGALSANSLPNLNFLDKAENDDGLERESDLSDKLQTWFASFDVGLQVLSRKLGPMVVTYFIKTEDGIKLSKIKSILPDVAVKMGFAENALRLNTAGSSAHGGLGIEVPRESRASLTLGGMMPEIDRHAKNMNIPICIGLSSLGETVVRDLTSFPHLMVAGSTGSGKSVALNNLIVSILGLRPPSEAQLVLIDPKAVEFSIYDGLPNLLTEVISDTSQAADCLSSLCEVMNSRYEILKENNVRNIQEYKSLSQHGKLKMPFIVVVIDELGDLMMEGGKDIENSVGRLAQKARAAGIHLVLATQRPTADIIKGLIKTNVPARLAFRVSSRVDSEVILGEKGAESLLGKGDALLSEVESTELVRIQAPFIGMNEIKAVCDQLR
ncbi:DNA translocase FtsK [Porticoccaceae bacterium]|nr:DNA translocase FtsK [Porticoccaceae bacterium]